MADHNVEGHFVGLLRLWTSDVWRAVWESLELEVESFERLGLPYNMSDYDLWQLYQQREIVLLTANRNDEGPDRDGAVMAHPRAITLGEPTAGGPDPRHYAQ